jgi:hypothetical protein
MMDTTLTPRLDLLHQLWEMLMGIQADRQARRHFDLDSYLDNEAFVGRRVGTGLLRTARELGQHFETAANVVSCGTVGCAMGFAKICIPKLQDLPMYYSDDNVARALEITRSDAVWCFLSSSYCDPMPQPKDVAERVKDLIDRYASDE